MIKIKIANWILLLNFLYYIIYNTYFGWNWKPINDNEQACDNLFTIILTIGAVIYFMPLLDMYDYYIRKFYKEEEQRERLERESQDVKQGEP